MRRLLDLARRWCGYGEEIAGDESAPSSSRGLLSQRSGIANGVAALGIGTTPVASSADASTSPQTSASHVRAWSTIPGTQFRT